MPRRVDGEGPIPCDEMWVGEGPGYNEDDQGRPFVGRAGELLNFHLFKNGIIRDNIYITNVVKYRCTDADGKDRPPTQAEITRDERIFRRELVEVNPKLIVCLGRTAARWFLGEVDMEAVHGIPFVTEWGVVIATYHPAAALHDLSGEMAALVADDIRQVGLYRKGLIEARVPEDAYPLPQYQRLRTAREVAQVLPVPSSRQRRLFVDTEGIPGRPYSLQFSLDPGHGYMILATDIGALTEFIGRARYYTWVMHNALYDIRICYDMGIDIVAMRIDVDDTMVMAYLDRLEPQGLKPLAYRHASMVMQSYDDLTSVYGKRQMMEWLKGKEQYEYHDPDPVMEVDSKTGEFKMRRPQNVARRIRSIITDVEANKLDKDGNPPDPRKRWAKVEEPLQLQVGDEPIFTLDLVPAADAIHYGCRDSDATARVFPVLWKKMEAKQLQDQYQMKRGILPMIERMMRVGFQVNKPHFGRMREEIAAAAEILDIKIKKQAGRYINCDSNPQVAWLIFGKLGLRSEILTKKGRIPSTNDKALEGLVGRHPVIQDIIDRRELGTMDGFARDLPRYAGDDGRIHCTLRITRVAQGRLAASRPPLLGIPVRSDIGKRLRGGFTCEPGRHLGSADLSQIEMLVMADESGDEILLDEMRRGIDIHAQNAIDLLGATVEQSTQKDFREPAKRTGFGIITGITEVGLYQQMRLNHIDKYTQADCAKIIRDYLKKYQGVNRYLNACRSEARRNGFVRDKYGMIRYLPGVWSSIPAVRAEAERQSHSHKISGTAQGIIQRAMVRLWQRMVDEVWPAGLYFEVLLQIHDELIWEGEGEVDSWQADLFSSIIMEELLRETDVFKVPLKAKATTGVTWEELK